jgi:eukaryotic-like serine/threonine-protein kinase
VMDLAQRLVKGRYRLRSLLGRGGMGLVWLAEDEVLRRPVALKELAPRRPISEELRMEAHARALTEARAAARVDHTGTVRVYDLVEEDSLPWIVMELLSGRTLKDAVVAEGPLPVSEVARLGVRLIDALQAIHRAGVVHRDIKPGNVYLCDGGRVVLGDFGIAWTAGDGSTVPDGEFAGSPAYVSPERVRNEEVGPASDLFSLGSTLYARSRAGWPSARAPCSTRLPRFSTNRRHHSCGLVRCARSSKVCLSRSPSGDSALTRPAPPSWPSSICPDLPPSPIRTPYRDVA